MARGRFEKNDPRINRNGPPIGPKKKTLWYLESLTEEGVDYQKMVADRMKILEQKLPEKPTKKQIAKLEKDKAEAKSELELLIKFGPYVGNKPTQDIKVEANASDLIIVCHSEEEAKEYENRSLRKAE